MPDAKPETVRELEAGAPGTRFMRLYEKRRGSPHGALKNRAFAAAGVLVVAAGIATYPLPLIPSEIVIVVGLALFAQGSRHGARAMDHAEVKLRRWFAPVIRVVSRWPRWAQVTAGVAWSLALAGLSWWALSALHR